MPKYGRASDKQLECSVQQNDTESKRTPRDNCHRMKDSDCGDFWVIDVEGAVQAPTGRDGC